MTTALAVIGTITVAAYFCGLAGFTAYTLSGWAAYRPRRKPSRRDVARIVVCLIGWPIVCALIVKEEL